MEHTAITGTAIYQTALYGNANGLTEQHHKYTRSVPTGSSGDGGGGQGK
jgi:hypothetical protein